MQVVPSGGQNWNKCKCRHLSAKFVTKVIGAMWWPNLEVMQVAPSALLHYMLAKFLTNACGILFSWRDNSSFRCYTLGLLCLWQCFIEHLQADKRDGTFIATYGFNFLSDPGVSGVRSMGSSLSH